MVVRTGNKYDIIILYKRGAADTQCGSGDEFWAGYTAADRGRVRVTGQSGQ